MAEFRIECIYFCQFFSITFIQLPVGEPTQEGDPSPPGGCENLIKFVGIANSLVKLVNQVRDIVVLLRHPVFRQLTCVTAADLFVERKKIERDELSMIRRLCWGLSLCRLLALLDRYSPKCLEAAFSEVRTAPVQHLWALLAEIGSRLLRRISVFFFYYFLEGFEHLKREAHYAALASPML